MRWWASRTERDRGEAADARQDAEAKLRHQKTQNLRAASVGARLRELRERNQFAEMMAEAFRSAR